MTRLLLLLFSLGCCYALPNWPVLKVKFGGFDCHNTDGFFDMPRTETEAKEEGFTKLSDCQDPNDSTPDWAGKRYALSVDHGTVLIYDTNGYIAGIQSGIKRLEWTPPPALQDHPFVTYQGVHYITFYFVDPRTICYPGRNASTFTETGTGRTLYIQNGTSFMDVFEVPKYETDLKYTSWLPTLCIPTMGHHYRHSIRQGSECDSLFPVFTMYNNGHLDGFGWTVLGNAESTFFEHPPVVWSPNTPECLRNYEGRLTGMHVYLTSPCGRTCRRENV